MPCVLRVPAQHVTKRCSGELRCDEINIVTASSGDILREAGFPPFALIAWK